MATQNFNNLPSPSSPLSAADSPLSSVPSNAFDDPPFTPPLEENANSQNPENNDAKPKEKSAAEVVASHPPMATAESGESNAKKIENPVQSEAGSSEALTIARKNGSSNNINNTKAIEYLAQSEAGLSQALTTTRDKDSSNGINNNKAIAPPTPLEAGSSKALTAPSVNGGNKPRVMQKPTPQKVSDPRVPAATGKNIDGDSSKAKERNPTQKSESSHGLSMKDRLYGPRTSAEESRQKVKESVEAKSKKGVPITEWSPAELLAKWQSERIDLAKKVNKVKEEDGVDGKLHVLLSHRWLKDFSNEERQRILIRVMHPDRGPKTNKGETALLDEMMRRKLLLIERLILAK